MAACVSERRPVRAAATLLALFMARLATAQDDYPADISPPAGTRYPCALTALPRGLPGIPEADRAFINHTYSRILRATQSKLVLLVALEQQREASTQFVRYQETAEGLLARQRAEDVPAGLEPFQQDVLTALELQRTFFSAAEVERERGGSMADVYRIPEGRLASKRLIAAWGRMQARYPGWPEATRDSIYHHLCALDLF
jgi:hypothetical protein